VSYWIYILYSEKDHKLYVGCTSDVERRVVRHNAGYVTATKVRRPLVLIYSEEYKDKAEAFNRERFLKSLWGSRFKKKVLRQYLENLNKG